MSDVIDHVGIRVSDLPASRRMYEAALRELGFAVLSEGTFEGDAYVLFGHGDLDDFCLHTVGSKPGRDRVTTGAHIAFCASDAGSVRRWHDRRGGPWRQGHRAARRAARVQRLLLRRVRPRPRREQRRGRLPRVHGVCANKEATVSEPKKVLEQAIQRWNATDRDGWAALYTEDVVYEGPGGARISGLADLKERYFDALVTAAPDRASNDVVLIAEGDHVVEQARYVGTHTGTWRTDGAEIPATGKTFDFPLRGGSSRSETARSTRSASTTTKSKSSPS